MEYMLKKLNGKNNGFYMENIPKKRQDGKVTKYRWKKIILPEDRAILYRCHNFSSPADQEAHICTWIIETADLEEEADPETGVRTMFYPARYYPGLGSIFAMGDILALMLKGDNATAAGDVLETDWRREKS